MQLNNCMFNTKKCSKCQKIQDICHFTKNKRFKDGYSHYCKTCKHQADSETYLRHKIQRKEYMKTYKIKNKDKLRIKASNYYIKNKIKIKTYQLTMRDNINKIRRIYRKNRYLSDLDFQIKSNLRSRISIALKNNQKNGKTLELLGCTIEQLKQHLTSKFQNKMTWKNYGRRGWHIDHKIPCDSFDLNDPKQQKKCFHYTNLQPLWWKDNLKKSNKLII